MAISLIRCDDRLIHGQCVLRILNDHRIDRIVMIEDTTAKNPVLKKIYELAVPNTTEVLVTTLADAPELIRQALQDSSKTLLLFKFPQIALQLFSDDSLKLPCELNIGPMSNRPGSKKYTIYSHLVPDEVTALDQISAKGVDVYFQQVTGEKKVPWGK